MSGALTRPLTTAKTRKPTMEGSEEISAFESHSRSSAKPWAMMKIRLTIRYWALLRKYEIAIAARPLVRVKTRLTTCSGQGELNLNVSRKPRAESGISNAKTVQ